MCKNGSLWDSLWLIRLPSFAECQTGPTWLQWDSYPAVCWPSVLNLSQLVCAKTSLQVFVVRIPDGFSLRRSEGRTWNGGTRIYICCWKGIYWAVCPEPCCEMLVRHWLNTDCTQNTRAKAIVLLIGSDDGDDELWKWGFVSEALHDKFNSRSQPVSKFKNILKLVFVNQCCAQFKTQLRTSWIWIKVANSIQNCNLNVTK